jgi:hypothetical protein
MADDSLGSRPCSVGNSDRHYLCAFACSQGGERDRTLGVSASPLKAVASPG